MHCNDELSYILSYQSKSYPVKSYQIFSQVRQSTPSSLPVGVQVLAAANRTALAVAKVVMIQMLVMQFIRTKELVCYIFFIFFNIFLLLLGSRTAVYSGRRICVWPCGRRGLGGRLRWTIAEVRIAHFILKIA